MGDVVNLAIFIIIVFSFFISPAIDTLNSYLFKLSPFWVFRIVQQGYWLCRTLATVSDFSVYASMVWLSVLCLAYPPQELTKIWQIETWCENESQNRQAPGHMKNTVMGICVSAEIWYMWWVGNEQAFIRHSSGDGWVMLLLTFTGQYVV